MQLVFVSVLKLNFSDGGPLYVGRAEHEGGLFPGKVKSVVFYLLGLVLRPMSIPVFVFTQLCSEIPCLVTYIAY